MKKLLSMCLVLIMLLSVFSITASAETMAPYYDVRVGEVYYSVDGNEAYITGYEMNEEGVPQGEIVIPETVKYWGKNYTVVSVEPEAFYGSPFTKITLPSSINCIYDAAFYDSTFLEQVVIPTDCDFMYFGDYIFTGTPYESTLYSQDEVIFGQNVLFSYIGNADPYVMPDNIDLIVPNAFFMSGIKSVVINDNITDIPYCAFASCHNLKSIDIPDNVGYISEGAFKDCSKLETVNLGNGVTSLGIDSFANTKIKSIHLGPAVYSIYGAFRGCKSLETITIDPANTALSTDGKAVYFDFDYYFDGLDMDLGYILEYYIPSKAQGKIILNDDVVMINPYAFYGCEELKEVSAKNIYGIDANAFANSGIEKVSADALEYVWTGAFKNCKNLTDINLSTVVEFGTAAFENCTSLANVTFSEDVSYISELAFSNTGLKNVTIYGDDCYIYESAFKGCKELETVRLEKGVSYVGMNAFLGCSKLKTIYLSKTVKYFEDNAFNGCDNVKFELIKNTTAYKHIKNNTDFDYEVVGNYSLFERIIDFFRSLFGLD